MSEKILLIEDDLEMQSLIKEYLTNYDFEVVAIDKPKEALAYVKAHSQEIQLIVLDLMLPQMDGFDVCKALRALNEEVYIIISSARNELSDKILGYGLGADDYLAKPYEPRELVLKINSALRRTLKSKKKIGDFEIDEEKMQIALEGYVLDLTKIEFDLLHLLLSNPGKVFSRETLFNAINGIGYSSKDRTVDMHVSNLRAKLGDDSKNPKYIKSVWGVGYQLVH
ncbi:MAG: response regulator transcription factor [Epsilonproteobacteria bacterium]|uniref:Phosphate regulon transcriptional regulatory protein PhoB n=1 Tax=Sulfurospirillum cavolei TaxID=366522 RepID=A0A2D3W9W5_9BACT|nr:MULTISPECIES: response regulator transcription factor [Sulfurospirillum]KHG34460.1 MAG: chemotaxis protein CheY [Sulfurospirillum sp. MES]NCB55030.1 response regulator transcription factor [Campylobacterota bacterium]DAB37198.1 MAG TPA: DNA-binding response regulator [Sulfurospirillum cavolei]